MVLFLVLHKLIGLVDINGAALFIAVSETIFPGLGFISR